jgi:hypothetical protein
MQVLGSYVADCDIACRLTWGFRLVLFWSYWSFLFIMLALSAAWRLLEARERRGARLRARSYEDTWVDQYDQYATVGAGSSPLALSGRKPWERHGMEIDRVYR